MAIGAVMTAVWDLRARREERPLWASLLALTPTEVIDMVDWTYISDFLDPGRARELLEKRLPDRAARLQTLQDGGMAAYTTTPGWLGYTDEKLVRLCTEAVTDGFTTIKLKVGADTDEDRRRLAMARDAVGPDINIAVDANQFWSVSEAIAAIDRLREFDLYWVEEPTHPDDLVGHGEIARAVNPVRIATGEMLASPIMARQLLQLKGVQVLQIDATRMAGVHDLLAVMLMAEHAGVDVIPHAGGVGLCEAVQHFAYFHAVAVAGDPNVMSIEYVDHLHDQLQVPVDVANGRYRLPSAPGSGTAFTNEALAGFAYPTGTEWATS
jgi:L-fuconate dehydratase